MTRRSPFLGRPALVVFGANLLALALARTPLAAAVAALGCVSALVLGGRRFSRWEWAAAAPMFAALGARWVSPQVLFLRVDQRVQATVAWLVLSAVLGWTAGKARSDPDAVAPGAGGNGRRATALFIAWSTVFWLLVVWDVGIGGRVTFDRNTGPSSCGHDALSRIFTVWDSHPASDHLFLAWRTPADYMAGTPYAHHSQTFLLWMYGFVKVVQGITASPLFVAVNLTPFMYIAVAVLVMALLLARDGTLPVTAPSASLWLFLLYGVLITNWRFWHDLYSFSADDPFPLVGALVVVLVAAFKRPSRWLAITAAAVLGALNPFVAPGLLLGVFCVYGKGADTWRALISRNDLVWRAGAWLTATALLSFLLPRALIAMHGYIASGSDALFRSGLDGDTRYFTSIWQAIAAPCPVLCCGGGRSVAALLIPGFVPLAVAALFAIPDTSALAEQGRRLAFVATPYLFSATLFPQAVSIHPYFYDHLLLVPVTIIGAAAFLSRGIQRKMTGAVLLVVLLLVGGLIMSNLISIAQSFPLR